MKRSVKIILSFAVVLVLASCSPPPPHAKPVPPVMGYRCQAVNRTDGRSGTGWSTSKRVAQSHAMNSCRQRSRHTSGCRIKSCVRTGNRAAGKYWYTCYVKNRSRGGLWSGTSHSRFTAMSRAFDRCRGLSSIPASCYFKYCRIW